VAYNLTQVMGSSSGHWEYLRKSFQTLLPAWEVIGAVTVKWRKACVIG